MSMGIGHFAFGASGTIVMIQMLPLYVRLRIRMAQVFIVLLGGAWALFPDLAKHTRRLKFINVHYWTKIGLPDLDRLINRISAFHNSSWANISFLHHVLDIVDVTDSVVVSSALVILMLIAVSLALFREVRESQSNNRRVTVRNRPSNNKEITKGNNNPRTSE